jgi:hypothetical protein
MIENAHDEERGIYVPPPLTDDETGEEDNASADILNVDADELEGNTTSFRFPVWLRESSSSFHWGWVPLPLRKAGRATVRWVKGPNPPRDLLFRPLFPKYQALPVQLLDSYAPRRIHKIVLLLLLYTVWFIAWFTVLVKSTSSGNIEGYGRPQPISCAASYWYDI